MTTKGRHYYNNGKVNILLKPDDEIPPGFVKGGLPQSEEHKKQQSETMRRRYKNGEIVTWNKGKKGVQVAWNKGKKGVQIRSEETKKKISEGNKGKPKSEEHKKHISESRLKLNIKHTEETKQKLSQYFKGKHFSEEQKSEIQQKQFITKTKNKSFNTSKPEILYLNSLRQLFNNVIYQYYNKDKYPYNVDFYIPLLDLYIECNFYPSHGENPFGMNKDKDIELLNEWKTKQKLYINSKGKQVKNSYYGFENVFTRTDPKKLNTAIKNKLNYMLIYRNLLLLFINGNLVYMNSKYNFQSEDFLKIALQKLASVNGWTVVTYTDTKGTVELEDDITYNKLVKPDETLVTAEELAKGVEQLVKVYTIETWDGKLPTYQMGENGLITVVTP